MNQKLDIVVKTKYYKKKNCTYYVWLRQVCIVFKLFYYDLEVKYLLNNTVVILLKLWDKYCILETQCIIIIFLINYYVI